jgi:hypothetical protein
MSSEARETFSSGEECQQLGAYETVCCRFEIVVMDEALFPDCPVHKQSTGWRLVTGICSSRPIDLAA